MRSPGLPRVAAPAEFRVGGRTVPALLYPVGAGRVRLCLRETDAVAARDVSAEGEGIAGAGRTGAGIAVRPRGAMANAGWIPGADLRLASSAPGASSDAVRMAVLHPSDDAEPTSRRAVDARPPSAGSSPGTGAAP